MKKQLRMKFMLLLFALVVGISNAWAQTITWERVTSRQTLFEGGTFIMGYEADAKTGIIIPLRSKDCGATTSANGILNSGTTDGSSTNGTINMSNLTNVTTSDYEVYITGVKVNDVYTYINIQRNNTSGNFYGSSSGGTSKNTARLYTSGDSNETNLIPEWSAEDDNQFKFQANVSGQYKYLKYNTGSPRYCFYNSDGDKIVFYKKIVKHTLTYSATNGSIDGVVYGTQTVVNSGALIAEGGKVTLTAQPAEGYVFSSWEVSGTGSSLSSTSTNPTAFTMGTADATITANFVVGIAYTITVQSNNNNYGTVALNGNVITANPAAGYTYASPAYTVSSGNATVEQNGNEFTVTPTSDCTVTINFAAIPTHTATFSVNGETTSSIFYEGQAITFPSNPAAINHKSFVGWYTAEYTHATTAPSFVNTAEVTMGDNDVTYYAVFANVTTTYSETETETSQTLKYDSWTYNGTTSDMTNYRLFAEDAYIESASFDLSILKQVDVYAGTYGTLGNDKKKVTITSGSTTWGTASLSTNSATTKNEITSSVSLSGNGQLHIVAGGGDGSNNGIRISKVDIITKKATTTISNYCTTVEIYTITAVSNNNEYGTVLLEGEVITGSPKSGYRYASPAYTVTEGTATVSQSGNEFIVTPTSDCTVRINFEAIPTYKATFYVNGTKNSEVNLVEGADIDFPEVTDLTDLKFVGWTTSAIDGTVASEPDPLVTEATMDASDIDYFAVFAYKQQATFDAADITNTPKDPLSLTWTHSVTGISINLSAGQHYTSGTPNTFTVAKGTSNYLMVSSTSKYLEKVVVTISGATYKVNSVESGASLSTSSTTQTITFTSKKTSIKCYATKDNQIRATTVSVTVLTDYCTNINSFTTDGNWNVASNWAQNAVPSSSNVILNAACTIPNGTVANVKNVIIGTAGSLTIADGGQLITNNAVQATVHKTIDGHDGSADAGWKFIASPIAGNTLPTNVGGMINSTTGNYDLYRFTQNPEIVDNDAKHWENYKAHTDGFNLTNGLGYLYANADGADLIYTGTINPGTSSTYTVDLDYTEGTIEKGWNLIGNPFTCNATIDKSFYVISGHQANASTGLTAIAPCTGVMVMAEGEDETVTFTKAPEAESSTVIRGMGVNLTGEEDAETIDNAIVSFNEGSELPKFYFGTQNANIYIPMDNEEFAIVSSNGQGEMPVNFRAYVAGEYTITVNPEEVEMGYLHLIDNIAGKDVDLLANPSYTFNARTDDYESRFRLVFSTTMVNAEMGEDFAFMSDGQLVIANEGEATLQVIDVTGRVVATENINGTSSMAINAKAGVYVLRLINGTDVKTQKMVIR